MNDERMMRDKLGGRNQNRGCLGEGVLTEEGRKDLYWRGCDASVYLSQNSLTRALGICTFHCV